MPRKQKLVLGKDYVFENGRCVLTQQYLLSKGSCCGGACPHCPYKSLPSTNSGSSGNRLSILTSPAAR